MANRRLYVVQGMGTDAVGLVRSLTVPIAQARGNIVDIRQDVMNGLFTFVAVVDLSSSDLRIEGFRDMLARIAEETGLRIEVDAYIPRPRDPARRSILLVLVGRDAPGLIAETAGLLSRYRINIESSRTVARQGVFLMELMCDMSHCAIPEDLLMTDLKEAMAARNLQAMFQTTDVFNKRKRVVLFDIATSFLTEPVREELLRHSGITRDTAFAGLTANLDNNLQHTASKLDGLGIDVLDSIIRTIQPTEGTIELIQTLKVMGYRIALASGGFSFFTDAVKDLLGLDHAFGISLPVDADTRVVIGPPEESASSAVGRSQVIEALVAREHVTEAEVTVLDDRGLTEPIGVCLDFDLATILSHYKRHILSQDALIGLMGAFGSAQPTSV